MTREAVVAEAKTWVGTPYHHYAGVKGVGTDCAFIMIKVFSSCGLIEDFIPPLYPIDWANHKTEEMYLSFVNKYAHEVASPLAGDIALYKFGRCVSHAGIVIDDKNIIHALIGVGVTYSGIEEGQLEGRLVGYYSIFKDH